jgi:hypothetical protein
MSAWNLFEKRYFKRSSRLKPYQISNHDSIQNFNKNQSQKENEHFFEISKFENQKSGTFSNFENTHATKMPMDIKSVMETVDKIPKENVSLIPQAPISTPRKKELQTNFKEICTHGVDLENSVIGVDENKRPCQYLLPAYHITETQENIDKYSEVIQIDSQDSLIFQEIHDDTEIRDIRLSFDTKLDDQNIDSEI